MRAADLPYDVKEQLHDQLRDKLGYAEYNRAVSTFGEDGLLDVVLQGPGGGGGTPSSRPASVALETPHGKALEAAIGQWWLALALACSDGWSGVGAGLAWIVGFYLVALFYYWVAMTGWAATAALRVAQVTVGLALLGALGYGLYIGVPWVYTGVVQWYRWLGSKF